MDIYNQALLFLHDHIVWVKYISWGIFGIGIFQNIIYVLQLPAAWLELREHSQAEDTETPWHLLISNVAMPINLLVPAYNEEMTIVNNVYSMLSLKYPDLEIIVINDGSKDRTLKVLIEAFSLKPVVRAHQLSIKHAPVKSLYASHLHPKLLVIDKENGKGKADAINAGINFSRNPLFCVVDADSLLEPEALLRSVQPFMEEPKKMIATGGTIRILNGCTVLGGQIKKVGLPKSFLPLVQSMEYIRAFLMARLAWSRWGMISLISGAFGIFKRSVATDVGGFSIGTVGEDYELIVKMHRFMHDKKLSYSMRYVPEPVCWTEAPESLKVLGTQRKRWQRGSLEVFFKHKYMLFNPRYGKLGMLGFPYNFISDVIGPIAEVLGYLLIPIFWLLGLLNYKFILAFLAIFFVFGIFISTCSLILEEMELRRCPRARDLAMLGLMSVAENFGYRQINNLWRIMGWWQFIRGHTHWGRMIRRGVHKQ